MTDKTNVAKKCRYLLWLLCPLVFVFWMFFYRSHLISMEQSGLFLFTGGFWRETAVMPGGLAVYCGDFLTQFYAIYWLGALVQTLLFTGVFLLVRQILKRFGISGGFALLGWLPALGLLALQCDSYFTVGDSLRILFFLGWMLGYGYLAGQKLRLLLFTLCLPLVCWTVGMGMAVALYITLMLYEILSQSNKIRFCVLLWGGLLVGAAKIWQGMAIIPDKHLFGLLSFVPDNNCIYLLLGFVALLLILQKMAGKKADAFLTAPLIAVFLLLVVLGTGGYWFHRDYNRFMEHKMKMDQAAFNGDWDAVLQVSGQLKDFDFHTLYYTNLALAMKGELPEKMFDYPQLGMVGLFIPRDLEYFNMLYGSEFYYRLGIINEAIHWMFEASVGSERINNRILMRLADLNLQNGYCRVAEKYLNILDKTWMYKGWAEERKEQLARCVPCEGLTDTAQVDYFIGGRKTTSDLARYYDIDTTNIPMFDYMACALLLEKDLNRFVRLWSLSPYAHARRLPKVYEEALAVVSDISDNPADKNRYPVSAETRKRYNDYMALYHQVEKDPEHAPVLMKKYKNTWWYYAHFTFNMMSAQ